MGIDVSIVTYMTLRSRLQRQDFSKWIISEYNCYSSTLLAVLQHGTTQHGTDNGTMGSKSFLITDPSRAHSRVCEDRYDNYLDHDTPVSNVPIEK